jgi:hypothetical protein
MIYITFYLVGCFSITAPQKQPEKPVEPQKQPEKATEPPKQPGKLVGPQAEKSKYPMTIVMNAENGFEESMQLNLDKDGTLFDNRSRDVADNDLRAFCLADTDKDKANGRLSLMVVESDTTIATLRKTLKRIHAAAEKEKIKLTVNVFIIGLNDK